MDIANILANASESIEFIKKSSILKFEIHGVKKSLHDFYEPCSEGKAELFGVYAIVKTSSKYNETVWIADFNSRKEAETSLVFLSVYFCSKEKRENMKKALAFNDEQLWNKNCTIKGYPFYVALRAIREFGGDVWQNLTDSIHIFETRFGC